MDKHWWNIGPSQPIEALRCEAGTGWKFSVSGSCLYTGKVRAICFFRALLTIDQMNIVNELSASGKLINGSYTSWNQFALLHGLELT